MEDVLLLLLGALLATGGGFINQQYQNRLNQRREDRELLSQAEEVLIEMQPYLEKTMTPPSEGLNKLSNRLLLITSRIRARRNLNLAEKLIEFASLDSRKTKDNAIQLFKKIAKKSSKALDRFHKKEDMLFKKAAEEMKAIMKNQDERQEARKL